MTTKDEATPDANQTDTTEEEAGGGANREAARYRRKLREAEAATTALQEQLQAAHQQILTNKLTDYAELPTSDEQTMRARLKHQEDLTRFTGKTLTDFLTEAGELDAETITVALTELHQERPELFEIDRPRTVPNTWDRPDSSHSGASWKDAFRPT